MSKLYTVQFSTSKQLFNLATFGMHEFFKITMTKIKEVP
jgi:hypothetical protein